VEWDYLERRGIVVVRRWQHPRCYWITEIQGRGKFSPTCEKNFSIPVIIVILVLPTLSSPVNDSAHCSCFTASVEVTSSSLQPVGPILHLRRAEIIPQRSLGFRAIKLGNWMIDRVIWLSTQLLRSWGYTRI